MITDADGNEIPISDNSNIKLSDATTFKTPDELSFVEELEFLRIENEQLKQSINAYLKIKIQAEVEVALIEKQMAEVLKILIKNPELYYEYLDYLNAESVHEWTRVRRGEE